MTATRLLTACDTVYFTQHDSPFLQEATRKSMKIQLLSDLHIEFEDYMYPDNDSDVVVLAGDIHTKDRGVKWAIENIAHKPILNWLRS